MVYRIKVYLLIFVESEMNVVTPVAALTVIQDVHAGHTDTIRPSRQDGAPDHVLRLHGPHLQHQMVHGDICSPSSYACRCRVCAGEPTVLVSGGRPHWNSTLYFRGKFIGSGQVGGGHQRTRTFLPGRGFTVTFTGGSGFTSQKNNKTFISFNLKC